MKKEVSCRIIQSVFEYAGKRNIPPETLCVGIPYSLDYLRNKQERIEWDVFCRFMANLRPIWNDEELESLGFETTQSVPFRSAFIVGRLLFNGPDFYLWINSNTNGPGAQFFSCMIAKARKMENNHLSFTLSLAPGHRYCREFFVVTKGALSAASTIIGLDPARVSMRETGNGAVYDILCPEGGGAMSWLRRAVRWPGAVRAAARELKEANEALHQRYAQLEEAREVSERQATRLKVAYDISQLIHTNLDLHTTLEAIARSLVSVAGFSAVTLSVETVSDEQPAKSVARAGTEPSGAAQITRPLTSHGKRLGKIDFWLPDGADLREAEELLDYVIPTVAMEIDDALSFALVNDYRNSLQQKVDARTLELKEMNESLKRAQAGRDRLFSNISHEFRTPLTLILGPLERIIEESKGTRERGRFALMKRNAEKLLQLINQLLELSRLQSGDVKLKASRTDLIPFLRGLVMSFRSLADARHIRLSFRAGTKVLPLYLDTGKAETLFNNLLVNAIKFTPDGGKIDVAVEDRESVAEVRIKDSGVGIPEDDLPYIFDRFYQGSTGGNHAMGGTGIGLALTRELAELHHGTVQAMSAGKTGTEFIVSLPRGTDHLSPVDMVEQPAAPPAGIRDRVAESPAKMESPLGELFKSGKRVVLVIDDDADVRQYVKDILSADMQVIEGRDGEEGIRQAQKWVPDLVISDVMMPNRDGNEVCRTLKEDLRTSHIPVILLTAKAGTENRIEGLETGADDYVVKPFVARELLARVKNLIALREGLRKRYGTGRFLKPEGVPVRSMEQAFLQKAAEIVERHMDDDGFGIDDFSREIGLSRTQLHRKLVALTGCSARDFLRRLRLERASDLLHGNAGTVSEIAYQVGFRDPSHFAKCYRKQFGVPPGAIRPPSSPGFVKK